MRRRPFHRPAAAACRRGGPYGRLLTGLAGLAVLTLVALIVNRLANPAIERRETTVRITAVAPTAHPDAVEHRDRPPRTRDPVLYAREFAARLWAYDSRFDAHTAHTSKLLAWMTPETQYADPGSVLRQIPDPTLWARMRDSGQYAMAIVTDARIPAAFSKAFADNPSRFTAAHAYAVTVTGKQTIRWTGTGPGASGSGSEDQALTVAVQCRPERDCALIGVAPGIAP